MESVSYSIFYLHIGCIFNKIKLFVSWPSQAELSFWCFCRCSGTYISIKRFCADEQSYPTVICSHVHDSHQLYIRDLNHLCLHGFPIWLLTFPTSPSKGRYIITHCNNALGQKRLTIFLQSRDVVIRFSKHYSLKPIESLSLSVKWHSLNHCDTKK